MKFFKSLFVLGCSILIIIYLISCCSSYISPLRFSFITIFAVSFPYLFLAMVICIFISLFIKKRLSFILLIFLLCGYKNFSNTFALNFTSKFQNKKQDSSLRIMTWNVEDFVDLRDTASVYKEMLQLIASYNPDVLCMQEFSEIEHGEKRVSIKQKLDSMNYHYCFFSKDDEYAPWKGSHIIRGSVIFSKQPLSDTIRVSIRDEDLNEKMACATINFYNKPLRINTTHLASFALYKDTGKSSKNDIYQITYHRKRAIQYKLRDIEQLHEKQVAIIRNQFKKTNIPIVYCGDMNTTPCTYTYRTLKGNMQDAFQTKGFGIGATFYKIIPTLRIDYLFADSSFKINQCTVAQKKLSDHYPVITDLSWK